jgi:hypothetical protein
MTEPRDSKHHGEENGCYLIRSVGEQAILNYNVSINHTNQSLTRLSIFHYERYANIQDEIYDTASSNQP